MALYRDLSPAILLQQAPNILTQLKQKKKYLKSNFMKMIKVLKEEMNKPLNEIKEKTKK